MRIKPALHASVFAAALACAAVVAAQEYPKLKPGQWELTTSSTAAAGGKANAPAKSTMCTDEAMQRQLSEMAVGMSKDMCSRTDIRRDGQRFVTTAECKLGESTIKSHAVMTLSGDSAYHTEISASYDPPLMGMKETKSVIDGKYTGACRDGLQPGDIVTASGRKINIRKVLPGRPPAKSN